jgi:hypothetical protein
MYVHEGRLDVCAAMHRRQVEGPALPPGHNVENRAYACWLRWEYAELA